MYSASQAILTVTTAVQTPLQPPTFRESDHLSLLLLQCQRTAEGTLDCSVYTWETL